MEKKLFIRFFRNKEETIPHDSWGVCKKSEYDERHFIQSDAVNAIGQWMTLYPNGKVDFVWL
jgi:hypothetical protein